MTNGHQEILEKDGLGSMHHRNIPEPCYRYASDKTWSNL